MSEKPENKPKTTIDNSTPAPADQNRSSAVEGELSETELSKATGGLVAVKTISWAHDDEAPPK